MPQIGQSLIITGTDPNFSRDQFKTLEAMKAYTTCDEGHVSYCIEDGKHYEFHKNNSLDDTTGKWREFASGGSNYDAGDGILFETPTTGNTQVKANFADDDIVADFFGDVVEEVEEDTSTTTETTIAEVDVQVVQANSIVTTTTAATTNGAYYTYYTFNVEDEVEDEGGLLIGYITEVTTNNVTVENLSIPIIIPYDETSVNWYGSLFESASPLQKISKIKVKRVSGYPMTMTDDDYSAMLVTTL